MPADKPYTVPPDVVATDGNELDHVPPLVESIKVTDAPEQTVDAPVIEPAESGAVATVTV